MVSGLVLCCLLAFAAAAPNALGNDTEPLYRLRNQNAAGLTPFGNDTWPPLNGGNQDTAGLTPFGNDTWPPLNGGNQDTAGLTPFGNDTWPPLNGGNQDTAGLTPFGNDTWPPLNGGNQDTAGLTPFGNDTWPPLNGGNQDTTGLTPFGNDTWPPLNGGNQDTTGLTPFGKDTRPFGNRGNQDVINGNNAPYGRFDYILLLKENGQFICGGSLISPTRGLTAAHCIIPGEQYSVVAGELDRSQPDPYEVERAVTSVTLHPQYNDFEHDIAILKFDNIPNSPKVSPIERFTDADGDPTTMTCNIAGWGRTIAGIPFHPNKLKMAPMNVMTTSACRTTWGNQISDSHVCVENFSSRKAACIGDSGGPLDCWVPGSGYKLVGVTSYGNETCPVENVPTVYTRVSYYADWIQGLA